MAVYFSPPEEEIINSLQEIHEISYLEAANQVLGQKRELAFLHQRRGNYELAKVILLEIEEWNDEIAEEFEKSKAATQSPVRKIILPD